MRNGISYERGRLEVEIDKLSEELNNGTASRRAREL